MSAEQAYSKRMGEALAFTAEAFQHKWRKQSRVPYLAHLLSVTAIVAEHGGSEDQMIAALLHDYLEDIEGSSAQLVTARFGEHVAELVLGLSDTVVRPKPPWKTRKAKYLLHLREASPELKLICAADKLHNAQSIRQDFAAQGEAIWARFTPSRQEVLWYYRGAVAALGHSWHSPLLEKLRQEVRHLHSDVGAPVPTWH